MRAFSNYTYQFEAFGLDPDERRLLHEGQPVPLTPKAFDTLVMLVERAGRLVEKEELMSSLWPDSYVEEANLAQHVWTLRKTLGETSLGGAFIETVPKKGFRFVATVAKHPRDSETLIAYQHPTSQSGNGTAAAVGNPLPVAAGSDLVPDTAGQFWSGRKVLIAVMALAITAVLVWFGLSRRRTENATSSPKTIAVLPFKPLSADSRDESLEMGMAETMITRLSNINQIVVRPMAAVRKYTDPQGDPVKIGKEVQAEAVLDGSIQKADGRVRVTVRLTDVRNGAILWAEQFDEKFTDIFKLQDSISERVARALPIKLSSEEATRLAKRYTDNPEAYELYLQAQYLWNNRIPENDRRMNEYYQQALAKDPRFALAYIGLAEVEMHRFGANRAPIADSLPKITANLTKALELDDSLAQAHNTLAEIKYQFEFEWPGAEKEFKRAIDLNANVASIRLAYGWFLMSAGRFDQATVEMHRAQELDPSSMLINRAWARLFYFMRQYDRSIQHLQRMIEAEPNVAVNHWALALPYVRKAMYAEAVEESAKAAMIDGTGLTPQEIEADKQTFRKEGWEAYLRLRHERMLRRAQKEYVSPLAIAVGYARLGNRDQAFVWLDNAIDARASGVAGLKIDPECDVLRSDPRFARALKRMNLSP